MMSVAYKENVPQSAQSLLNLYKSDCSKFFREIRLDISSFCFLWKPTKLDILNLLEGTGL